jgi:ketosteroid isomerase-like protein
LLVVASNSELLLAGYDAWNQYDLEGWLELLDPDVVVQPSGVFPGLAPEYRGHERAATFWRQMHEPWAMFRIDVDHIEDEGDTAIASIRFRGRGADSGVEVDMRFGMAMRVRDGLAVELVNRRTFDEARTALRPSPEQVRPSCGPSAPRPRPAGE